MINKPKKRMKYVVLVADGMPDYPIAELGGKTPLEAARTPQMDYLADHGRIGTANFVPGGMTPGSDVANLSIFGYEPKKYYAGRGPLEAANLGIDLQKDEIAFRCNFVTRSADALIDYSAGHISSRESHVLINFLNQKLSDETVRFYPGVGYRHLLVIKSSDERLLQVVCRPPHDIMGKKIDSCLPAGEGSKRITGLMERSYEVLSKHEINLVRVDLKENPANMIWLWGQGKKISLPTFPEKYNLTGAVISAVDLIKGLGKTIGLEPVIVPGATGYYDTNYPGKAQYALKCLKKHDFVFVHVEAPDEAGHNGDLRAKIQAIENFDRHVVGAIASNLKNEKNIRIMVLADHPTPLSLRTHTADPVCFLIYGRGMEASNCGIFSEASAKKSALHFTHGHELMDKFITADKI